MSGSNPNPSRWYYVLALLIPIFACLGTILFVYPNVPKLPGALEGMGINDLTQVIVPGSAEVFFPKAGGYAVYYEYRSIMNGVRYIGDKYPPRINCQLTSKTSGAKITPVADYVEGNMYATDNQERVGVLIMSIMIREPGMYIFSCHSMDGRTYPQFILAVGPNIVWEFFNIAVKPLAAIFAGTLVSIFALGISILIIVFVAFKRHQSKNIKVSQA